MKHVVIAAAVGLLTLGIPPLSSQKNVPSPSPISAMVEGPAAQAGEARRKVRRAARRTTRRVIRRHQYYRSLPRGCIRAAIRGRWYWRCGGVYYSETVDNGVTVYIIVNP